MKLLYKIINSIHPEDNLILWMKFKKFYNAFNGEKYIGKRYVFIMNYNDLLYLEELLQYDLNCSDNNKSMNMLYEIREAKRKK